MKNEPLSLPSKLINPEEITKIIPINQDVNDGFIRTARKNNELNIGISAIIRINHHDVGLHSRK